MNTREDQGRQRYRWQICNGWIVGGIALCLACNRAPTPLRPPKVSPRSAGAAALDLYDVNDDGLIGGEEFRSAVALKSALGTFDTDGDQQISADEIATRVGNWQSTKVGLITIRCSVSLDDRPLADAVVTYDPDPFLGEQFKAAEGLTDRFGNAVMSIPKQNRPTPDTPSGVQFGLYRVRISKREGARETVPAKYNEQTILGQEISYDDPGVQSRIAYRLNSR